MVGVAPSGVEPSDPRKEAVELEVQLSSRGMWPTLPRVTYEAFHGARLKACGSMSRRQEKILLNSTRKVG